MIGIIGGTGLTRMEGLQITRREMVKTPYGTPSCPLVFGRYEGTDVVFLSRHGAEYTIPPHRINYRANIYALREAGVSEIIAFGAVGGIAADCGPCTIVVPDQIVDYTHGRAHTFFDGPPDKLKFIDFTYPYTESLRDALICAAQKSQCAIISDGCYGATQGPRLETAAEIARMAKDGCTIVGMTGMPEAALARDLDLDYACIAFVVNWAPGIDGQHIDMQALEENVAIGTRSAKTILAALLRTRASQ